MSRFNNFCCINNMLSIRFFLDNILPAARKQRFRKASKGSFDTPSVKSKKGFLRRKKTERFAVETTFSPQERKNISDGQRKPRFLQTGFSDFAGETAIRTRS